MSDALLAEQLELAGLKDIAEGAPSGARRLHSKYDPWKEARTQLPENLDPARTLIVFGAGFGYVVQLMLDAGLRVVWVETEGNILKQGLAALDFRAALRDTRLRITSTITAPKLEEWRLTNEDCAFWSHRAFLTPALSRLKQHTEFLLNRHSVNQATLARFEKTWAVNLCSNLLSLSKSGRVKELFGCHAGKPAVVIGAGPSLTDSLERLAAVRNRAIFVAVDTAVRVLQHRGIDPDFIVTVDPQPVNRVFLESYRGSAAIVVDPTVSLHSARHACRNRTFVSGTPFQLGRLFELMLGGSMGELAFGGSVSTNAYDLARKMGCDPVFLVGQDLAFSDGQVHAKGAALEERLSWLETRMFRREMHNFAQLTAIPPLTVEDMRGGLSQTNGKLAIFYRWFEARFQADLDLGLRIVNCTERGAKFNHVPRGMLEELQTGPIVSAEAKPGTPNTDGAALLAEAQRLQEVFAVINSAYRKVWDKPRSQQSAALEELGLKLRLLPELELLGNTAQGAIQRLRGGADEDSLQDLHKGLHSASVLLERCLSRVTRVLSDLKAPGS